MVYDNILRECEERGITIAKLEKEAGLKNGTIRKWGKEDGNPTIASLEKVALYLKVPVAWLVRGV